MGHAQIQGRRNETPSEEHMKILRPFAVREDWGGRKGYWPRMSLRYQNKKGTKRFSDMPKKIKRNQTVIR